MATREVTIDDVPMGTFIKAKEIFAQDGATYVGLYQGHAPSAGQYGGTDYTFKNRKGDLETLTASKLLEKMLAKVAEKEPLKVGEKVTITRTGSKETTKGNDMIIYKVKVDPAPAGAAPAAAPKPKPVHNEDW